MIDLLVKIAVNAVALLAAANVVPDFSSSSRRTSRKTGSRSP